MDSTPKTEVRTCAMCCNPCTDPVSLSCEHNYCRLCMERVLDIQDKLQFYYCTQCFKPCQVRPLEKQVMIPLPSPEQIVCTYCATPAMKTCTQCDSSFCATHLTRHPNLPGHTLIEPTLSLEERKCSTHKELLKYYCSNEGSFICVSCCVAGDHKGHQVILLQEFAEQKKSSLRPLIEKFQKDIQEAGKQIDGLEAKDKREKKKADVIEKKVTARIHHLTSELRDRRAKFRKEISEGKKLVSLSVNDHIMKLDTHKKELSMRMKRVKELCDMEDPLTFLKKERESNITGIYSGHPWESRHVLRISETSILVKQHKGLLQFADGLINRMLKDEFPKMEKSVIKLDEETAHYTISITSNLRGAYYSAQRERRAISEKRFTSRHVLSLCSFSSGNHYWEVDVVGMKRCIIGVACHSMNRKTIARRSTIGFNEKSWSLCVDDVLSAYHNSVKAEIPTCSPMRSFGIFLEYEAGRLSFYQLCDPIRHLHTFTTTFNESLHAAFFLDKGSSITVRE